MRAAAGLVVDGIADADHPHPPGPRRRLHRHGPHQVGVGGQLGIGDPGDRSEEHTSELQSLMRISYAVFCLQKKRKATRHELDVAAVSALLVALRTTHLIIKLEE